jgi:hypothetical protein
MNGKAVDDDRDLPAAPAPTPVDYPPTPGAKRTWPELTEPVLDRLRLSESRSDTSLVHAELDREGRAHVLRGGGARGDRRVRIPASRCGPTIIPILAVPVSIIGTFVGHAPARLLDQHADAVRA